MSMRKTLVLMTIGALPLVACGGSEARPGATPARHDGPEGRGPRGAAPPAGSGSVSGKISFEGTAPAAGEGEAPADPKCAAMHTDGLEKQSIQVKDGGLADVLVYVKSGPSGSYTAPAEPALLDQKGCDYSPHMLAVQAGQPIKIRNSDDTLHNIHPRPTANTEFNIGQPRQGMESSQDASTRPSSRSRSAATSTPGCAPTSACSSNPFFAVTRRGRHLRDQGPARRRVRDRGVAREAARPDPEGHRQGRRGRQARLHVQGLSWAVDGERSRASASIRAARRRFGVPDRRPPPSSSSSSAAWSPAPAPGWPCRTGRSPTGC